MYYLSGMREKKPEQTVAKFFRTTTHESEQLERMFLEWMNKRGRPCKCGEFIREKLGILPEKK